MFRFKVFNECPNSVMVVEHQILPYFEWLAQAAVHFIAGIFVLAALSLLVGYLISAISHGPTEAVYRTARVVFTGVAELFSLSGRRIYAIARLSFQESLRRRGLIAFVIFILILLFAGWFLDPASDNPGRLYISFVLTATNFLVLVLALFVSTFSLPNDFKNRTIYTIITKPVCCWEIVLGRIIGFGMIGTLLLIGMGFCSYMFVIRGLQHAHDIDPSQVDVGNQDFNEDRKNISSGKTSPNQRHRHTFMIDSEGHGTTDSKNGHRHAVSRHKNGGQSQYDVGNPEGLLLARVPRYGKLRFLDKTGRPGSPISVGKEWTYRGYFAGGTLAAAIWQFEGVTRERYPQGLPLEMQVRVFRTYVGDVERGIAGTMIVRNPNTGSESTPIPFIANEFEPRRITIPVKFSVDESKERAAEIDLFEEYVADGQLDIIIRCDERAQYFGVAQADAYLREPDGSFAWNFAKGYLGIWLQMLLFTSFGVMFSTLLSGAVSLIANIGTIVLGFFVKFVVNLAGSVIYGQEAIQREDYVYGGGPLEAFYRIVTQMNVTSPLEESFATSLMQWADMGMMYILWAVAYLVPDYSSFSNADYVAYGYNVPADLWVQQCSVTVIYIFVITCLGYFFLRTREIAA